MADMTTHLTEPQPTTEPAGATVDHQAVVDRYLACWNTDDAAVRADLVRATWTDQAHYVDPLFDVTGHAELEQLLAAAREQYPGSTFRQRGGPDAHHDLVRWGWEMLDASGDLVVDGIDVAVLAADGRISHLAGFFGSALAETR
jgi:hypothetical protein